MARLKNGIFGPIIGKLANVVGYVRLGQPVLRSISPSVPKQRTPAQLAVNERFKVVMAFISPLTRFINVSFRVEVLGTTQIAQNAAVSYNVKNAVKGIFPGFEMDYSKALVSKGVLPTAHRPAVEFSDGLLTFHWEQDPETDRVRDRDQVMMVAFLPANNRAYYSLSGARRIAGTDVLEVHRIEKKDGKTYKKDLYIETYISFISDDRQSISDSVYVGRIDL